MFSQVAVWRSKYSQMKNDIIVDVFLTIITRKITINNLKCQTFQSTHHHYYNNPSHLHIGSGHKTFVSRGNIINLLKPKDPKAFPYHIPIDPAAASDPPHCTGLNKLTKQNPPNSKSQRLPTESNS